jgi:LPPG:FO 2-phospho-L-lactate transferase
VTNGRRGGAVLALSGGIGGAKLALGLDRVLDAGLLHVVANVGDDFSHLGLRICPDIDTLLYTLSGVADPGRGWGRRDETWNFMATLAALGGPAWFQLGDRDLALHVERTRRLAGGETLAAITADIAGRLGVRARVWPASDDPVRTRVLTSEGWLAFQQYFVAQRCGPVAMALAYEGADEACACEALLDLLRGETLRAVVLCPSNPLLSIAPMLAIPALRRALADCRAPVVAVSPIVGDASLKGPTAKLLRELGHAVDALEAARRYEGLLDGYVVDARDAALARAAPRGVQVIASDIVMDTLESKERLARVCLQFADSLAGRAARGHLPA